MLTFLVINAHIDKKPGNTGRREGPLPQPQQQEQNLGSLNLDLIPQIDVQNKDKFRYGANTIGSSFAS